MYHGNHENKQMQSGPGHKRKIGTMLLTLLLIAAIAVTGTMAYLAISAGAVENTFKAATVSCKVTENFDGATKSHVNVVNTSDTDAYIRVKLVTYRANDKDQHIGGTAAIPSFTPGANWVEHNGYYYYTLPVAPGEKPVTDLIDSIALTARYTDADGGKQVIEVMAEAIQNAPAQAAGEAWGVTISAGSVANFSGT